MRALVLVSGPDPERERDPVGVDDQVETAARAAAQRAADLAAPFFESTSDASAIARDQSTLPSRSSSSCTRTSSCSQTPARRHSWNRQQVCPDGHPSTGGSSAQGIAYRNTNKIPSKQARSSWRLRPGKRYRRCTTGNSGSISAHNRSDTRHGLSLAATTTSNHIADSGRIR